MEGLWFEEERSLKVPKQLFLHCHPFLIKSRIAEKSKFIL